MFDDFLGGIFLARLLFRGGRGAGSRAAGHGEQEHGEDYRRHDGHGTSLILKVLGVAKQSHPEIAEQVTNVVRVGVNEVILAAVASSAMTSLFVAELRLIDLVHVSESLGQDTSATTFLEAPAGEGDEQSSLFGRSGLFGSSGGASDPANQTHEIDKIDQTDHPPRPARLVQWVG